MVGSSARDEHRRTRDLREARVVKKQCFIGHQLVSQSVCGCSGKRVYLQCIHIIQGTQENHCQQDDARRYNLGRMLSCACSDSKRMASEANREKQGGGGATYGAI